MPLMKTIEIPKVEFRELLRVWSDWDISALRCPRTEASELRAFSDLALNTCCIHLFVYVLYYGLCTSLPSAWRCPQSSLSHSSKGTTLIIYCHHRDEDKSCRNTNNPMLSTCNWLEYAQPVECRVCNDARCMHQNWVEFLDSNLVSDGWKWISKWRFMCVLHSESTSTFSLVK